MPEYQLKFSGKLKEIRKLVPNLRDKEKYAVHYLNLQQHMSLGLKLKKIHRALECTRGTWMELYIRMNAELRKNPTSEKDLFKLMKTVSSRRPWKTLEKELAFNQ